MPKGKTSNWIRAQIFEPFYLGKRGIEIVVWPKHYKQHSGTVKISVGGITWQGYNMKKPIRISWEKLQEIAEG